MIDFATIEQQALSMDRGSRGRLASTLLRSLDEMDEETMSPDKIEELWLQEIQRRNKEWDDDPSIGIPAEEVFAEMRKIIAER